MNTHDPAIDLNAPPPPVLARVQFVALVIGLAGAAACALGAMTDANQFFHSYLTAFMLWLGVALGSLAVAMVQYLSGGVWGFLMRRPLEAASRVLPLVAVLFIPLLFGLQVLYPWARPEAAADRALQAKSLYLNVPFFIGRAVCFFAVWLTLAFLVNRWSREHDRTGDPAVLARIQRVAAPGLVLYAFTITFAVIDWVMSLEPHWYSTIFGLIFVAGQGLSALAFATLVLIGLSRTPPLAAVVRVTSMRDIGNLVLAFVLLWAYTSFSQLLLIWAGNLPEEIPFYLHRIGSGWQGIGVTLAVFHFFVPFVLLLLRRTKQMLSALRAVVVLLLCMRFLDLFWMIAPETHQGRLVVSWMDFATVAAVGGLWVSAFAWHLRSRPLLPLRDTLELTAALERH